MAANNIALMPLQRESVADSYLSALAQRQQMDTQAQANQRAQAQEKRAQSEFDINSKLRAIDTLGGIVDQIPDGDQQKFGEAVNWAVQNGLLDPNEAAKYNVSQLPQIRAMSQQARALIAQRQAATMAQQKFDLDKRSTESNIRANDAQAMAAKSLAARRGGAAGAPNLTNTDKREIYETDELVGANKSAISLLRQARELSDRSLQGPGAGAVASVTSIFGDTQGENTLEFDNLLKQQVLPQLKAIFGGMPTEGERKVLLDLQGSSGLQRNVRNKIIDNALRHAAARLRFNQEKAQGLRTGTYYGAPPEYNVAPPPDGQPAPDDFSDVDAILGLK